MPNTPLSHFWILALIGLLLVGGVKLAHARESPAHLEPRLAAISADFPYEAKFVEVLGSRMHYVEEGSGEPILLLHGNPTSSYLWRNVISYLKPRGRVIAVDNIGMGKSDKPDIAYTFQDHSRYIDAFIDTLDLTNLTLVGHDWGSVLGLSYATRHEANVKGVVFMEALIPPVYPRCSFDSFGPRAELFRAFRDPEQGRKLLVEQNLFIEQVLPEAVLRRLTEAELNAYREPFTNPASRKVVLMWPNELPIAGEPARNVKVIEEIGQWLTTSKTPKLLQYVSPGSIISPDVAEWMTQHYQNIEIQFVGYGYHFIQEDNPEAIGRGIADWMRRLPYSNHSDFPIRRDSDG